MSEWQTFVIWVSVVGSFIATIGCSWAAIRIVSWQSGALLKASLILSATMALVYCLSYLWLLSRPTETDLWSETMRPVGSLAWLLGPWTALPYALIRQSKKLKVRMEVGARKVIEEVREEGMPSDNLG